MLTKCMPGIGFVDKTYAKNRLCGTITSGQHSDYEQNISKRMPKLGYVDQRRSMVYSFCQSIKPGVFRTKK